MSDNTIPTGGLFDEIDGHLNFHRKRNDNERAKEPDPEPTTMVDGRPSLILPADPDEPCTYVPAEEEFEEVDTDYLGSRELRLVGEGLIERHARFAWLKEVRIGYLWALKGALKHEQPVWSSLSKPTGPLRFFAGQDLLLIMAADHATEYGLTNYQVESRVFHELQHAGRSPKGKLILRGHELEMFNGDVEVYGLCFSDLKRANTTFQQAQMEFGGEA